MVDKANDIYNRWSNGQELPTVVLQHITEDGATETEDIIDRRSPPGPPEDPFQYTHPSLAQCIAEVHQIANTMFPLRKPCNCAAKSTKQYVGSTPSPVSTTSEAGAGGKGKGPTMAKGAPGMVSVDPPCPPSHGWSPPPVLNASSPVLPDVPPMGLYNGGGSGVSVGYSAGYVTSPHNNNAGGNMQQNVVNGKVPGAAGNPYPSLKGSGTSSSSMFHHKSAAAVGSPVFGHANASVGGVGAGGSYSGYPTSNSAGVGMFSPSLVSPTSTSSHGTSTAAYSNNRIRTPATPPILHHPGSNGAATTGNEIRGYGNGTGLYASVAVLPASGPPVTLRPSSKIGVVDTINFELGALSASNDQSFMVFY